MLRNDIARYNLGTGNWIIPGKFSHLDHACKNNKLSYVCVTSSRYKNQAVTSLANKQSSIKWSQSIVNCHPYTALRVEVHAASQIVDSSFQNPHTKVNNLSSKPAKRTRHSDMRHDSKANKQNSS